MARLRNRIRKADYFSDGDLLRWPRDKRTTYSGLYAVAEDSGCIEDDVFTWKVLLWPGPLDGDITVDVLKQWRDELVAEGKLIEYRTGGVHALYLRSFHRHEHPRNPQAPQLPLPPWVKFAPLEGMPNRGHYTVEEDLMPACSPPVQDVNGSCTEPVQDANSGTVQTLNSGPIASPVQSSPVLSFKPVGGDQAVETVDKSVDAKPSGQIRKKKKKPEQLPDLPVTICGPVAKIVGRARVSELLADGTDLNTQCRRLIALIDRLADEAFAHLTAEQRADRRDDGGGGIRKGKRFKAVQTDGPSGGGRQGSYDN